MTAVEALWHLLNALAAPFGLAVLSTAAVKLIWRKSASGVSWIGLLCWGYLPAVAAHLGTWSYTGAEGTMLGYGLMVSACAIGLWLRVFIMVTPRH